MSKSLKKCNGCGKFKPFSDFPIDRSRKDGHFHWCFDCNKKKASERRKTIKQLDIENAKLKVLLKECEKIMTDCLYKIYDEGGHSYPLLEKELRDSLPKVREVLK